MTEHPYQTSWLIAFRTWHSTRLIAAVLLTVALAGCKVGPNYSRPEMKLPGAYSELDAKQSLLATSQEACAYNATWWEQFDDSQMTSLIGRAVAANNSVKVAAARVQQARAARDMAQSLLYPQIDLGASALRFRASEAAVGIPNSDLEGSYLQAGISAAWTLDLFGGTRRLVESAQANEESTDAQRRAVVLTVVGDTARLYLELRGVQRQLEVAHTTLEEQRQTLWVTEEKRRNGLSSELEVVRARTEVEATASEIPPIEQAIRQYIHALSTLLSLEPTALSAELMPTQPLPAAPGDVQTGVPSDLLRRRPDIQEAERHLAASTAMVGVATAQLFPQMVLGGAGGVSGRNGGQLFNGSSSNDSSSYYLAGPAINWTIFDAGRRKAAIRMSAAEVEAAKAVYADTVLNAFREVESALVAMDRARARVEDLKRLSISARQGVNIAQRDYRNGLLDQLTVLDAQRQSSRADMLLVQGQVALTVNTVALYKALGGGWEIGEPAHPSHSAHTKEEKQ